MTDQLPQVPARWSWLLERSPRGAVSPTTWWSTTRRTGPEGELLVWSVHRGS